jgi:hypothetical protein
MESLALSMVTSDLVSCRPGLEKKILLCEIPNVVLLPHGS